MKADELSAPSSPKISSPVSVVCFKDDRDLKSSKLLRLDLNPLKKFWANVVQSDNLFRALLVIIREIAKLRLLGFMYLQAAFWRIACSRLTKFCIGRRWSMRRLGKRLLFSLTTTIEVLLTMNEDPAEEVGPLADAGPILVSSQGELPNALPVRGKEGASCNAAPLVGNKGKGIVSVPKDLC
ncbi:hypothetical protein Nepgr_018473 [Nepenthes gracilis]|uniref:Uncharacterized protein n=1 Tax=Nepenthes gracilis TaxID=150966 RepID=A0AAD3XT40_NEPGR|nr:hypothetical protein Nepgr_018473 [Nepenthes gracilis]